MAYLPLFFLFLFAVLVVGGFLVLSHLLGPKKRNFIKELPYECGINPVGSAKQKIAVKFYLVAMLFIVFDVEVVFLYPWAVLFRDYVQAGFGTFLFIEMGIFLGILVLGLIYVYGQRALKWE